MGYTTKQSTEILDFLRNNKDKHLTAEEVYYSLRQGGSCLLYTSPSPRD